eukprot:CAMPEP_0175586050 /NCGR_PEP_ID=MMETSP0096-20121207/50038_1 /TAXON_ID=311494 /ORGANISM="Alexandrium monilatum, Strain CCMP3105" /LENGTH=63 /DNA_ID=CAMNT_0016889913 /DNA_START=63 /DNA_END=254 /DNA_ORIENTATION=-
MPTASKVGAARRLGSLAETALLEAGLRTCTPAAVRSKANMLPKLSFDSAKAAPRQSVACQARV